MWLLLQILSVSGVYLLLNLVLYKSMCFIMVYVDLFVDFELLVEGYDRLLLSWISHDLRVFGFCFMNIFLNTLWFMGMGNGMGVANSPNLIKIGFINYGSHGFPQFML